MSVNIVVIDDQGNTRFMPYAYATNIVASKSRNGVRSLAFELPMTLKAAMALYPAILGDEVRASWFSEYFFKGRIEDVEIKPRGIKLTAVGYWNVSNDNLYTALWSSTNVKDWLIIAGTVTGFVFTPDKYNIDQNGRLYISCKKNQVYQATGSDAAGFVLKIPYGSNKKIVGFSLDFTINLPNIGGGLAWSFDYALYDENYAFISLTNISSGAGTGVPFNRTIHITHAAATYLVLTIYNNTGANNTPAGEDGANYIEIRNIRAVTTTANRVNTTGGAAIGSAGTFTRTPASMSNIYVGQTLEIEQGTNVSERVTVTAVTSTTFTATYLQAAGHPINFPVNAHVTYADEVVTDILTTEMTSISQITSLIQSPLLDIYDLAYEDTRPSAILNELANRGDTSQQLYEVGVDANKQLYFRPKGYVAQTYYVDVTDIDTIISLENVYNSIYGIYRDSHGRKIRSASNTDTASINAFNITRTNFVDVSSTSSQQASLQRDTKLADEKNAQAKARITFDRIYNANGGSEHISKVNNGDIFIIRNFPFTLVSTSTIDKIKSFRLLEISYDVLGQKLTVTPEDFIPTLDLMLRAQRRTIRNAPFIPGF